MQQPAPRIIAKINPKIRKSFCEISAGMIFPSYECGATILEKGIIVSTRS